MTSKELHVHILGNRSFAVEGLRYFLLDHALNGRNVVSSKCFDACEDKFVIKKCVDCVFLRDTKGRGTRHVRTRFMFDVLLIDDYDWLISPDVMDESQCENELFEFLETFSRSSCDNPNSPKDQIRMVVLTGRNNAIYLRHLINTGLKGLVHITSVRENILHAIETVSKGEVYIDAQIIHLISGYEEYLEKCGINALSRRELEVLLEISSGLKNQQIARRLFISVGTVERHKANMEARLGLNANELSDFARINADGTRYLLECRKKARDE